MNKVTQTHHGNIKFYSTSAALCVEHITITDENALQRHTVNLEISSRISGVTWENKIVFQLSEDELPMLSSILVGYMQKGVLHRKGKRMMIERQRSNLYISAFEGSYKCAIPIIPVDVFKLCTFVLQQLKLNTKCDDGILLASLRSIGLFDGN